MKEITELFNTPITLWDETTQVLFSIDKSWNDVVAVGNKEGLIDLKEFERIARESWFDADPMFDEFGDDFGSLVAQDLVLWGSDYWLTRDWGHGYEHWELHQMPTIPTKELKVKYLSLVRTESVDPAFDIDQFFDPTTTSLNP